MTLALVGQRSILSCLEVGSYGSSPTGNKHVSNSQPQFIIQSFIYPVINNWVVGLPWRSSVLRLHLPLQEVQVWSPVRELIFLMPPGQKHKNRSNTVTNSIKTIKNGPRQKKNLKKKKIWVEVIYVKGDPRKHWSGWSHEPGKTR